MAEISAFSLRALLPREKVIDAARQTHDKQHGDQIDRQQKLGISAVLIQSADAGEHHHTCHIDP